jgi:uncharacterized OB-fold protein
MENQFTVAAFNGHLAEHRLMGTRDSSSGAVFCPPRPIDPLNHSYDMEWVEFKGTGRLEAYTVVFTATSAMLAAGYDRKNPYCVGIVKLDEGPMISAQILGVDVAHPEAIQIGIPVKAAFVDRGEGEAKKTFLAFEPV